MNKSLSSKNKETKNVSNTVKNNSEEHSLLIEPTLIKSEKNTLAVYSQYFIKQENKNYEKILKKTIDIDFNNYIKIIQELKDNIEDGYEYSVFTPNREIVYDNKTKGGRITYSSKNCFNTYDNKNLYNNNSLTNNSVKKNFKPIQKNFIKISLLLILKNFYINNKEEMFKKLSINIKDKHLNEIFISLLSCIEGVLIQKNAQNIKLVVYIDEDIEEQKLRVLGNTLRVFMSLSKKITFCYTGYKKSGFIII